MKITANMENNKELAGEGGGGAGGGLGGEDSWPKIFVHYFFSIRRH